MEPCKRYALGLQISLCLSALVRSKLDLLHLSYSLQCRLLAFDLIYLFIYFYIFTYFHVPCDSSVYFVCTTCFLSSVRPHPGAWNGSVTLCGPRSCNSSPPSSCTVHDETCNTRAHLIRAERASSYANCLVMAADIRREGSPCWNISRMAEEAIFSYPPPIMCGS